ncbi:vacuolar protein-sorting-associated protein 24 [[Candida] anglica]|uniref:Vacuolar protein-sorting-associated protein 24 n=1 Tax=[Candida] anglica TaxID=148631 RepID=A0ABP0EDK3_9ASCO
MDFIKKAIWGPDPKEQMRKINQLLRKNKRELDRSLNQLQPLKKKTEGLIKRAAKDKDYKSAKIYARELINITKQYNKLHTSKTRVDSIAMAVNEQWQMAKLTNSLQVSTGVMKDVNSLINLGMVQGTMQELSRELMKAGIINEMMDDMVDLEMEDDELEDESQDEVNKIIQSLTEDKFSKIGNEVPKSRLEVEEPVHEQEPEALEEDDYEALDEMRERLKALQN